MHKTIELVKDKDGIYREGKTEPKQATFRQPKRKPIKFCSHRLANGMVSTQPDMLSKVIIEINDKLVEIGMEALNELTRGFFR